MATADTDGTKDKSAPVARGSSSSGGGTPRPYDPLRELRSAPLLAVRNGALGYGLRVVVLLLRCIVRRRLPSTSDIVGNLEFLKTGACLAVLTGGYRSLKALLAQARGGKTPEGFETLLAAFLAGRLAARFVPADVRGGLSSYLFVRALYIVVRIAVRAAGLLPPIGQESRQTSEDRALVAAEEGTLHKVARWPHYDTLLMVLASTELSWAYFWDDKTLPPSYHMFLTRFTARPASFHVGLKHLIAGGPLPQEYITHYCEQARIPLDLIQGLPSDADRYSRMLHPNTTSDFVFFVKFFVWHFFNLDIPLYFPLKLAALFFSKGLLRNLGRSLLKMLTSTAQSSLFLAAYCTAGWASILLCIRTQQLNRFSLPVSMGTMCGLATVLEAKSRRIELAMYVGTQALQSTYAAAVGRQLVPRVKNLDMTLFGFSMAVYMYAREKSPEVLPGLVKSALNVLLKTE